MKKLLVMCVLVLLAGCSTSEKHQQQMINAALAERPLVKFECPEYGCVMKSFQVNNPNQVSIPKVTNGWDAVTKISTTLMGVADRTGTMYLLTETMKEGIKYARATDNSVNTTTTTTVEGSYNTDTQTSNVNTEGSNNSQSSSIADSYNSSSESVTTTTTTSSEDSSTHSESSSVTTTDTAYTDSYNGVVETEE